VIVTEEVCSLDVQKFTAYKAHLCIKCTTVFPGKNVMLFRYCKLMFYKNSCLVIMSFSKNIQFICLRMRIVKILS